MTQQAIERDVSPSGAAPAVADMKASLSRGFGLEFVLPEAE